MMDLLLCGLFLFSIVITYNSAGCIWWPKRSSPFLCFGYCNGCD